ASLDVEVLPREGRLGALHAGHPVLVPREQASPLLFRLHYLARSLGLLRRDLAREEPGPDHRDGKKCPAYESTFHREPSPQAATWGAGHAGLPVLRVDVAGLIDAAEHVLRLTLQGAVATVQDPADGQVIGVEQDLEHTQRRVVGDAEGGTVGSDI